MPALILFLILINDLAYVICSQVDIYADETTIYSSLNSKPDRSDKVVAIVNDPQSNVNL